LSAATAGVLLSKSLQLSGEVHLAMQSRGFRGEVHVMRDFRIRPSDWCWLGAFATLATTVAWWGR
jgi:energy-coupling factor transporter transmembrane protein EcfT